MLSKILNAGHTIKIKSHISDLIRVNRWVQEFVGVNKLLTTDINFGDTIDIQTSKSRTWTVTEEDYTAFLWLTKNEHDAPKLSTQIRDPFFMRIENVPRSITIMPTNSSSSRHKTSSSQRRAEAKRANTPRVSKIISTMPTTIIHIYKKDETTTGQLISNEHPSNILDSIVYSPQPTQRHVLM